MQAIITAEFWQNIPEPIRRRLNLQPGTVMDFDEQAPFLKAVPTEVDHSQDSAEFQKWLAASIGLAKGKFTTDERMQQTRGED